MICTPGIVFVITLLLSVKHPSTLKYAGSKCKEREKGEGAASACVPPVFCTLRVDEARGALGKTG